MYAGTAISGAAGAGRRSHIAAARRRKRVRNLHVSRRTHFGCSGSHAFQGKKPGCEPETRFAGS